MNHDWKKEAMDRVRAMDRIEKEMGFASTVQCGPQVVVKTTMAALEAGRVNKDWSCVEEAWAMLQQLLDRYVIITAEVGKRSKP